MPPAPHSTSGSLYIGDLHPDVTEVNIFELVKDLGPIISIRVCRDTITDLSLGYAYVNFLNPIDAERAIDTYNHALIKGKPIRIMWSQRDPSVRKSGVGNVFVKNLSEKTDNKTLYDAFSAHGNILSCKVVTDPTTGASRGYGFVHFEAEDAAQSAIKELNNGELDGAKIFVGPFVKRTQRTSSLLSTFTNVYVKEMIDMDIAELSSKFEKYGTVTSACTKKEPRLAKTFGFVNFSTHEEALKAIEECHDKEIEGLSRPESKLYVQRAMKRAERDLELRRRFLAEKAKRLFPPGNNLYVKNLPDGTTQDILKEMFSSFGEITSVSIMKDFNGVSKGFGFICFKEASEAKAALSKMNGKAIEGKPLYVNLAQKKDARRSMLEMQYAQSRAIPAFHPGLTPMLPAHPHHHHHHHHHHHNHHHHHHPHAPYPPPPPYGYFNYPAVQGGRPGGYRQIPLAPRGAGAPKAPRGGYRAAPAGPGKSRGGGYQRPPRPTPAEGVPPAPVEQEPVPVEEESTEDIPLTAESLAAMTPQEQKNALGEKLYHKVFQIHPEHSPKITGMLLEMDVSETLNLLESPAVLEAKVNEALAVLKASA